MKNSSQKILSPDRRPTIGRLSADSWPTDGKHKHKKTDAVTTSRLSAEVYSVFFMQDGGV